MTKTSVAFDLSKVTIPLPTLAEKNITKNSTDLHATMCNGQGDIMLFQSCDINPSPYNPFL